MQFKYPHRFPLIEYMDGRKIIGGPIGHGLSDEEALEHYGRLSDIKPIRLLIPEDAIIQYILSIRNQLKQMIIPDDVQKFALIEYPDGHKIIDRCPNWTNQQIIDDIQEHPDLNDDDIILIPESMLIQHFDPKTRVL